MVDEWVVIKDICPHPCAALRLEANDGQSIFCRYYGKWFESEGK
jgi:phenylpropionate dioxygenase-like ring-hydroxylating dioxygenase large terminal subunit